jgi:hypothetical protein
MRRVRALLVRCWSDESGGLSVEFAVLFPALILVYMAMFVFWDAFHARSVVVRATETVADMMSRETGSFDEAYLEGMHEVFEWLASGSPQTQMRLTAVGTTIDDQGGEVFDIFWSHATSDGLAEIDAEQLRAGVPTPAVGEQLLVLETFYSYAPLFGVAIPAQEFHNLVATRPRYVPRILWSGA